jgi:hypothetical protein
LNRYEVKAATFDDFGWLARKTGCVVTSDMNAIKAIDASGKIRGMVGYCNWTKNCVQMHMAVDAPIVWRSLLRPALVYPFSEVGVGMVVGVIRGNNRPSLRFAKAAGLTEVWRLKDGFRAGEDWVFLQLLKEDCRYLLGNEAHHAPLERRAA